jgi:FlaA1/EpsC-like NDP-sugar epimerase
MFLQNYQNKIRKLIISLLSISGKSKKILIVIIDIIILNLSFYLSISARLGVWFSDFNNSYFIIMLILPLIALPIFSAFGLYSSVIRFFSLYSVVKIFFAVTFFITIWGITALIVQPPSFPRSVILINFFITLTNIVNIRLLAKLLINLLKTEDKINTKKNVAIYGVSENGIIFYQSTKLRNDLSVHFFIDHSSDFKNRLIENKKIINISDINLYLSKFKIDEIYIPDDLKNIKKSDFIFQACKKYNVKVYAKSEYFNLDTSSNIFEKLDYKDFLERDHVISNSELLNKNIFNKVIFISGGGGSIGSEIVNQCILQKPKELIIFEQNEYALFKILEKLKTHSNYDYSSIKSYLGSIEDNDKLNYIFKKHKPHLVFHAAAYKHVGILENNIKEAFKNNVIGTYNISKAALDNNVLNFVNISTDKAVNPSSIMGKTKYCSEKVIKYLSSKSNHITKFSTVRFGNVISSSGSVIPIFQEQIKRGGPVTVSHPDVKRYFMSTVEASQLVIQSSLLGISGDVFYLEMGDQIKIIDVAKKMISVYQENQSTRLNKKNIDITITGLKKGEKIQEELSYNKLKLKTAHPKIYKDNYDFKFESNFEFKLFEIIKNINNISNEEIIVFLNK